MIVFVVFFRWKVKLSHPMHLKILYQHYMWSVNLYSTQYKKYVNLMTQIQGSWVPNFRSSQKHVIMQDTNQPTPRNNGNDMKLHNMFPEKIISSFGPCTIIKVHFDPFNLTNVGSKIKTVLVGLHFQTLLAAGDNIYMTLQKQHTLCI